MSDRHCGLCDETRTPWGLLSKCAIWGCSRLLGVHLRADHRRYPVLRGAGQGRAFPWALRATARSTSTGGAASRGSSGPSGACADEEGVPPRLAASALHYDGAFHLAEVGARPPLAARPLTGAAAAALARLSRPLPPPPPRESVPGGPPPLLRSWRLQALPWDPRGDPCHGGEGERRALPPCAPSGARAAVPPRRAPPEGSPSSSIGNRGSSTCCANAGNAGGGGGGVAAEKKQQHQQHQQQK